MRLFPVRYYIISGFCLLVVASTVNAQVPATNKILKKTDSVSLIPNNTLTPGAQQGAMKLNPQATTLTDTSGLTVASTDSLGLNEDVPFSFANPQHYVIAAVRVTGSNYLDPSLIASVTGIYRGEKIVLPGDQLSDAIKKLWSQQLFANVAILIDKIQGDKIYLNIHVTERPRLAHFYFKGVSRTQASELKDKVSLTQ